MNRRDFVKLITGGTAFAAAPRLRASETRAQGVISDDLEQRIAKKVLDGYKQLLKLNLISKKDYDQLVGFNNAFDRRNYLGKLFLVYRMLSECKKKGYLNSTRKQEFESRKTLEEKLEYLRILEQYQPYFENREPKCVSKADLDELNKYPLEKAYKVFDAIHRTYQNGEVAEYYKPGSFNKSDRDKFRSLTIKDKLAQGDRFVKLRAEAEFFAAEKEGYVTDHDRAVFDNLKGKERRDFANSSHVELTLIQQFLNSSMHRSD